MNKAALSAIVKRYGKRCAGGGYEVFIPHVLVSEMALLPKITLLQEEYTPEGTFIRLFPNTSVVLGEYKEVPEAVFLPPVPDSHLSDALSEPEQESDQRGNHVDFEVS